MRRFVSKTKTIVSGSFDTDQLVGNWSTWLMSFDTADMGLINSGQTTTRGNETQKQGIIYPT